MSSVGRLRSCKMKIVNVITVRIDPVFTWGDWDNELAKIQENVKSDIILQFKASYKEEVTLSLKSK